MFTEPLHRNVAARTPQKTSHVIVILPLYWRVGRIYREQMSRDHYLLLLRLRGHRKELPLMLRARIAGCLLSRCLALR
jgi:hypothetical protein